LPLDNARHERFVQGLLEGKTASQAYADAGYRADDGNAAHLPANEKVKAHLLELQGEVVRKPS
jgi:phage terminase small subunit